MTAATTRAELEMHRDNAAVDRFAVMMKNKLRIARMKGRTGWQDCSTDELWKMLREHVEKGDPRDVANLAMMIWHNNQPTWAGSDAVNEAMAHARTQNATLRAVLNGDAE